MRKLLTVGDVCELLNLPGTASVYTLVRENRLPGCVRVGRAIRFDPDALERYVRSGGQALPGGWRRERAKSPSAA